MYFINEILRILNDDNMKKIFLNLTFEKHLNFEDYNILFFREIEEKWNGDSTCDFLEIYKVFKGFNVIGYIGRKVTRTNSEVISATKFKKAKENQKIVIDWSLEIDE